MADPEPLLPWRKTAKSAELREAQQYDENRLDEVDAAQQATAAQTSTNTGNIGTINGQITAINGQITALQAADIALDNRLDVLEAGFKFKGARVTLAANQTLAITFASAFANSLLAIILQELGTGKGYVASAPAPSVSGFSLVNDAVAKDFYWYAIGT
jgi:hypothetical protein